MNYLAEILAFHNWIRYNSAINKSDVCLWYCLMSMANRFCWEEFNVPIATLISESKLTKNEIYKSRNRLKQFGLIDFKERGGNKSTIYKINSLVSVYGTQIDTQIGSQSVSQSGSQSGSQSVNIHKTKNLKPETKNKKESKGVALATFEIHNNRDENSCCEQICDSTGSVCRRKSTYKINGKNYCNQHSKEILKNIQTCEVRQSENSKKSFDELIDSYTQSEQLRFELKEHLRTRKAKKATLTNHAIELSLRKLDTLASSDEEKVKIVQNAIERGYTGFFPLPEIKKSSLGNPKSQGGLVKYTNYDSMNPDDWVN